ncbi:hypothetical protein KZ438_08785, partial [Glaesserella parasuis]|nr:hypothetical protein [Glaesserella parasuis]
MLENDELALFREAIKGTKKIKKITLFLKLKRGKKTKKSWPLNTIEAAGGRISGRLWWMGVVLIKTIWLWPP